MQRRVILLRLDPDLHVDRHRFVFGFLRWPLVHTLRQRLVFGFLRLPLEHGLPKVSFLVRLGSSCIRVIADISVYDIAR
jgi:hypothetical protein